MRMRSSRVAGIAVLATVSALLLGGCQLREGPSSEYGSDLSMPAELLTAQNGAGNNN
jgi:hypothetical protein